MSEGLAVASCGQVHEGGLVGEHLSLFVVGSKPN